MNYYLAALKKYTVFSGRTRRKEFWLFYLSVMIIAVVAAILDNVLGLTFKVNMQGNSQSLGYGWLYILSSLFHLVPSIAASVRRLHDIGKSGWFYLICFIPLIGGIWLLVLYCTKSDQGPNKYGEDPKAY